MAYTFQRIVNYLDPNQQQNANIFGSQGTPSGDQAAAQGGQQAGGSAIGSGDNGQGATVKQSGEVSTPGSSRLASQISEKNQGTNVQAIGAVNQRIDDTVAKNQDLANSYVNNVKGTDFGVGEADAKNVAQGVQNQSYNNIRNFFTEKPAPLPKFAGENVDGLSDIKNLETQSGLANELTKQVGKSTYNPQLARFDASLALQNRGFKDQAKAAEDKAAKAATQVSDIGTKANTDAQKAYDDKRGTVRQTLLQSLGSEYGNLINPAQQKAQDEITLRQTLAKTPDQNFINQQKAAAEQGLDPAMLARAFGGGGLANADYIDPSKYYSAGSTDGIGAEDYLDPGQITNVNSLADLLGLGGQNMTHYTSDVAPGAQQSFNATAYRQALNDKIKSLGDADQAQKAAFEEAVRRKNQEDADRAAAARRGEDYGGKTISDTYKGTPLGQTTSQLGKAFPNAQPTVVDPRDYL